MNINTLSTTAISSYAHQQLSSQVRDSISQSTQSGDSDKQNTNQSAPPNASPATQVQIKSSVPAQNLDTVRAIEQLHARLNEQAKSVRETNEALTLVADKTFQLQNIVKNFPPFSEGDDKRQQTLMSYLSLRKEIEQLMVPQPPPPIYENVKKMWDSLFAENGQVLSSAVPAIDKNSSDKQLKDASVKLATTGEQISSLSNGMTNALIQGR